MGKLRPKGFRMPLQAAQSTPGMESCPIITTGAQPGWSEPTCLQRETRKKGVSGSGLQAVLLEKDLREP